MIEVDRTSVGDARRARSVYTDRLHLLEDLILEAITKCAHRGQISALKRRSGNLHGLPKRHNSGNVLCSRSARALVASAVNYGIQGTSLPNVERTDALRRVHFV